MHANCFGSENRASSGDLNFSLIGGKTVLEDKLVGNQSHMSPLPEDVVLRRPVERVKRAQSKIYEEDDVNIWDDTSAVADTLITEPDGAVVALLSFYLI